MNSSALQSFVTANGFIRSDIDLNSSIFKNKNEDEILFGNFPAHVKGSENVKKM